MRVKLEDKYVDAMHRSYSLKKHRKRSMVRTIKTMQIYRNKKIKMIQIMIQRQHKKDK